MTFIPNETEDGRAARAGIWMLTGIGGLILLLVVSNLDYVPRIIRFKGLHPSLFWWTTAVIGTNVVTILLAAVVLWNCPPRPLIPDNRLTMRVKQIAKFLVSVATFGLAAFWGALAGAMMPERDQKFTYADFNHLLSEVVGTPLKLMAMFALVGLILALCLDLYIVGREKRQSTFTALRPAIAWLCTFLTSPLAIGIVSYTSLAMIVLCGTATPPT